MPEITESHWFDLNDQLLALGVSVLADITQEDLLRDAAFSIHAGFVRKAIKTLEAIQLLSKSGYWEEAEALTRVLIEIRSSFDWFRTDLDHDAEKACRRVFDAMVLEKLKQINSYKDPDFQAGVRRADWDQALVEVKGRWQESEVEAMKRNGFTGLNVEARCQATGMGHVYQICYRNYSRNVHGTDHLEQFGGLHLAAR